MSARGNTYHYKGPFHARRHLTPCAIPGWNAATACNFQTPFASTTNLASPEARGMRQHGYF